MRSQWGSGQEGEVESLATDVDVCQSLTIPLSALEHWLWCRRCSPLLELLAPLLLPTEMMECGRLRTVSIGITAMELRNRGAAVKSNQRLVEQIKKDTVFMLSLTWIAASLLMRTFSVR